MKQVFAGIHNRAIKLYTYTMVPASGPLFRHGGTGRFIVFFSCRSASGAPLRGLRRS